MTGRQREGAISRLSAQARGAMKRADEEAAYWSSRMAAALAKPFLTPPRQRDFREAGWWMEGGEG